MSFRFTPEEMSALSDEQRDMVLDVAVGALLADGDPEEVDVSIVEADLLEVPWGWSESQTAEKVASSLERVAEKCTPEESMVFLRQAVEVLTDPNVRAKTLALAMRLAFVDGELTKNEDLVLSTFATAFEVPLPTVQKICKAVVKGE